LVFGVAAVLRCDPYTLIISNCLVKRYFGSLLVQY